MRVLFSLSFLLLAFSHSHPDKLECQTTRLVVGSNIMGAVTIPANPSDGVNFTIDSTNPQELHIHALQGYFFNVQNPDPTNSIVSTTCPWVIPDVNCTNQAFTEPTPAPGPPGGKCHLYFAKPIRHINAGYSNNGPPVKIFNV